MKCANPLISTHPLAMPAQNVERREPVTLMTSLATLPVPLVLLGKEYDQLPIIFDHYFLLFSSFSIFIIIGFMQRGQLTAARPQFHLYYVAWHRLSIFISLVACRLTCNFICIMSLDLVSLISVAWHRLRSFCSMSTDMQFILYYVDWQFLSVDMTRTFDLFFTILVQFRLFCINTKWFSLGNKSVRLTPEKIRPSQTYCYHTTLYSPTTLLFEI